MSKHWKPAISTLEADGVAVNKLGEGTRVLSAHLKFNKRLNKPLVMPIHHTSTYKVDSVDEYLEILQDGGYIYERLGNPSVQDAECRIRNLEGGAGTLVFNTGMSCICTILIGLLKAGDHVICQNPIYSAVHAFLSKVLIKFNIEYTWVTAGSGVEEYKKNIKPNTRLMIGESPSNPRIDVIDLEAFAELGRSHNILTLVDTTYVSPCLVQPIKYGIDLVVHSGTKYMGGHSDSMAGVLTVKSPEVFSQLQVLRAVMGPTMSPFEASLLSRGLKTLPLRMKQHCENGLKVAEFLHNHPKVGTVFYPGLPSHPGYEIANKQMSGFSGMMSFEMKDGLEAARTVVENVKIIQLAVSLGGVESLIEHPATMTHGPMIMSDEERAEALITDGLIRLSVGLEDIEDLIEDLRQALDKVGSEGKKAEKASDNVHSNGNVDNGDR